MLNECHDGQQKNKYRVMDKHAFSSVVRKFFEAGPDDCAARTRSEGGTRPRGRLCRWKKVKGAGKRKNKCRCRARYRTESPQTLLSAEQFGRQLCMKQTSSTTLEKKEARRSPSGGASTTSFTSLSLFLSLTVFVSIYLFIHVLSDTLAVYPCTSPSLLLTHTHTQSSQSHPHSASFSRTVALEHNVRRREEVLTQRTVWELSGSHRRDT